MIVVLALFPALAAAQELGVSAEIERPLASTGGIDPTFSATEVDAERRPSELDTLANALSEVPGARLLASGAYGSTTTLALRGSDADQVELLFGDVPIATPDGSAFDLSTVPLWLLSRIEVYRSGAPTWLGAGGIGGLLRLVPREGGARPRGFATLGAGSFGLMHARAGAEAGNDDIAWLTAAGVTSSEGDFPYLDDRRTAFDASDDIEQLRENGFVREAAGLGHFRARLFGGRLESFFYGLERLGGVPGPASQPTRHARRNETLALAGLGYDLSSRDWRVAIATSAAIRRRRFTDLFGEIGLSPSLTDDLQWRSVLRVAATGRAAPFLEITGVGIFVHEELSPYDALAREPRSGSIRDGGTFALEGRFFGRVDDTRLELRPSARLVVLGSRLSDLRADRPAEPLEATGFLPTFRIGGAMEPIAGIAITASASSAMRAPTMIELFGDRGYLRGDATLRPERAETIDLGLAMRGRHESVAGRAELRGFLTFASDLIRYRQTSRYTAVPENVESAMLFGAELGVHGSWTRHFTLTGALTLLDTRTDYLGALRRLPMRPWLTAMLRPELSAFDLGILDRLDGFIELIHVSESHLSAANEPGARLAARTRVAIGMSAHTWEGRLRLDLSVGDVFDQRGTDLLGFPLSGRSFSVALTLRSN